MGIKNINKTMDNIFTHEDLEKLIAEANFQLDGTSTSWISPGEMASGEINKGIKPPAKNKRKKEKKMNDNFTAQELEEMLEGNTQKLDASDLRVKHAKKLFPDSTDHHLKNHYHPALKDKVDRHTVHFTAGSDDEKKGIKKGDHLSITNGLNRYTNYSKSFRSHPVTSESEQMDESEETTLTPIAEKLKKAAERGRARGARKADKFNTEPSKAIDDGVDKVVKVKED